MSYIHIRAPHNSRLFRLWKQIVLAVLRPQWVAFTAEEDNDPELALRIWGINIGMFRTMVYVPTDITSMRTPQKFEFGESLRPIEGRWWSGRYLGPKA